MRILLDECLPRELADELAGHEVRTVQQEGWAGLENGELLQRAATTFAVFVTVDKRIHSTQRLPKTLAVITIRAKANRIQTLRPLVPEILRALEGLQPGTFVQVGGLQGAPPDALPVGDRAGRRRTRKTHGEKKHSLELPAT